LTYGVDRYGVHGMLGRQLLYREIIRMNVFRNIVSAYKSRAASQNFATWAKDNPEDAKILAKAEILAKVNENA